MSLQTLIGTSPETQITLEKLEEVKEFLINKVRYDHDAITYDSEGSVSFVKNKTPSEVERDRKATCMSGVFYAAKELRQYLGEQMITIVPLVQKRDKRGRYSKERGGIAHGMYLFKIDEHYGAISKSREELLQFVPPEHDTVGSLVLSSQILGGYARLTESRDEFFSGIMSYTKHIREEFPNYDNDANNQTFSPPKTKQLLVFKRNPKNNLD